MRAVIEDCNLVVVLVRAFRMIKPVDHRVPATNPPFIARSRRLSCSAASEFQKRQGEAKSTERNASSGYRGYSRVLHC